MLDIYVIQASLILLIVVLAFSPPLWVLICILIGAITMLVITWKRLETKTDDDDEVF